MRQLSVKVAAKHVEAIDVVSLELVSAHGQALPTFSAGAHIDIFIPGGLIRQYSLLNDCTETSRYLIGVLRDQNSRGGSVAVHDQIQVGDVIQISEPRNRFTLVSAPRSILFAGGIGVTPLLCMARRLQAVQSDFTFHYCSRTLARTAFYDEIVRSDFATRTQFHFDDDAATHMDLDGSLSSPDEQTQVYVCGPVGFIDYVTSYAQAAGWLASQIHVERFAVAQHIEPLADDQAFQVKLSSTGEIFDIPPNEPITKVLDRQGVFIPVSCEEGICGTCLTGVVAGIPDHRDSYLTDDEHAANDQFTPCVSRSRTPLLIIDV